MANEYLVNEVSQEYKEDVSVEKGDFDPNKK